MEEKNVERNEVVIDFGRMFKAVLNKIWLVALVPIVCAIVTFLGTFYFVTPLYNATAMFYVNNSSVSFGDTSFTISSSDISASRNLVKSYVIILKTRETLLDVIDYAGVDISYGRLSSMVSAEAVDGTQIFQVVVKSDDPEEATKLANAIEYILPNRIKDIVDGTSAKVVASATKPTSPSSPDYVQNAITGFIIGLFATVFAIILRDNFDVLIRTDSDINRICSYPILASVPDMNSNIRHSSYYYGYEYGEKKKRTSRSNTGDDAKVIGPDINFAAAEAYKRLRTKLQFSFSDGNSSHVIGISSAMTGEGKSLTAVNLAYMLAQLDKKVILIDCDMRRPSLAVKLNIEKAPGLSDFLSGQASLDKLVQRYAFSEGTSPFDVLVSGRNPPNPIELLSSKRMHMMLDQLRRVYDYIVLDLPPVGEVSDALAVAKITNGMLLVVRQHYCNRYALSDTVRQFEFMDAKILGIICNCANDTDKAYTYRKGYRGRYYRRYRRYEGSYAASGKAAKKATASTKEKH